MLQKRIDGHQMRYSALWYALHVSLLRRAQPGAWGPQIGVGLLVLWLNISLGARGGTHEVRVTWPWRGEPLLTVRLGEGRLTVRALPPGLALASLGRLLTHGAD